MKVIWERDDVKVGLVVGHPSIKERLLIGYLSRNSSSTGPHVVVSLSDGMVQEPMTKQEVAQLLTSGGWLPVALLPPTPTPPHHSV